MRPLSLDEMRANTAMRRLREDDARRAAERLAAYRADPDGYLARKRAIGAPAVPPPGAGPICDHCQHELGEIVRGCAGARREREGTLRSKINPALLAEPSKADISEMRSAFLLAELTDWCKRQRRDELKEHLNQAFRASRLGLKVIRWEQWT